MKNLSEPAKTTLALVVAVAIFVGGIYWFVLTLRDRQSEAIRAAHDLGAYARTAGATAAANPYNNWSDKQERLAWLSGWSEMEKEAE